VVSIAADTDHATLGDAHFAGLEQAVGFTPGIMDGLPVALPAITSMAF